MMLRFACQYNERMDENFTATNNFSALIFSLDSSLVIIFACLASCLPVFSVKFIVGIALSNRRAYIMSKKLPIAHIRYNKILT